MRPAASCSTRRLSWKRSSRKGGRRRPRRLRRRAVHRAAARDRQRRRHPASRGVDRGGAGPGRCDRRRAGGSCARVHSSRTRSTSRRSARRTSGARALHPTCGELGTPGDGAGRRRAERIELAYTAPSPATTPGSDGRGPERSLSGSRRSAVNYVNAPVIAAERGVEVVEERRRASRDFTNRAGRRALERASFACPATIGREHRRGSSAPSASSSRWSSRS